MSVRQILRNRTTGVVGFGFTAIDAFPKIEEMTDLVISAVAEEVGDPATPGAQIQFTLFETWDGVNFVTVEAKGPLPQDAARKAKAVWTLPRKIAPQIVISWGLTGGGTWDLDLAVSGHPNR